MTLFPVSISCDVGVGGGVEGWRAVVVVCGEGGVGNITYRPIEQSIFY